MPSTRAKPITTARIMTSARAVMASPPTVTTQQDTASKEESCRRYRWAGCTASEIDCFLLSCGNLGGRRKTSAFSFQKQIRIEAFAPGIVARRGRYPAGAVGVHLQGRGYGIRRWKAIQLGRVE